MSFNMRIGGLASGMDIDQIVSDLMKAERIKVDKLEQEKQILEWQQEDYRTINSLLRSFRDNFAFKMKLQSTYLVYNTTSSDEGIVTAAASSTAIEGSHSIRVDQLARGASLTGGTMGSAGKLTTLDDQFNNPGYGDLKLVINDVEFIIDTQAKSIYDLVQKINRHSAAGVSLNTTQEASTTAAQVQKLKLADSALTEGLTITVGDKKIALWDSSSSTYESEQAAKSALGADYLYDIADASYDTADEIMAAIAADAAVTGASLSYDGTAKEITITSNEAGAENAVSAAVSGGKSWDVRASYDETLDRFFLFTNKTGADQHLKVKDSTLAQLLKITDGTDIDTATLNGGDGTLGSAIAADGRNADVTIDNLRVTDYTSNQFTLNGVTYNLQNADPAKTVYVNVQRSTDSVFDAIKSLVDEYNKIVEAIENKLSEKRYKDYNWPLSDWQKENLTDKQVDQWQEKARSGMLRNDYTLRSIRDKLRYTMAGLAKIGITTTKDYFSSKLEVDEDKLRKAVQQDSQGVMELFTKESDEYSGKGVAQRLSDDLTDAISTIIDKAGTSGSKIDDKSFIGRHIGRIEKDIDRWEERLKEIEDRYWRQFTAMEKAINQMNQQSMWLMQQFGMGM
ncbi:flagellar hook-associated protein 2 [Desulfohalotomaculum tongense]|uniref:flagellar filament capping protein FliD n=1 Tax=Desulforadius tongensis TaxID=1216062 RepID=UPI00195B90BF|nr:flagellar filament capping protein FliD [Desulforadius tongensis]MBM7854200.1 flagellar hook-associated protein 2 [Desulforadius tongensis]